MRNSRFPYRDPTPYDEAALAEGTYPRRAGFRLTVDHFLAGQRQTAKIRRMGTRTSVALSPTTLIDVAGNPGAGTLAGTSTAAGVVPTDATNGFPPVRAFPSGASGWLYGVRAYSHVIGTITLFDLLWKGGAYAFNANTTLSAQPTFESRIPNGDYDAAGLEIWFEAVTAFTGNITLNVTYTNGAGSTGRTAGAQAYGIAPIVGRMFRVPMQLGDNGVRKIESVVATVATVGTFNVLVARRLWEGRIVNAQGMVCDPLFKDGDESRLVRVFDDSALYAITTPDSTTAGPIELDLDIVAA